MKDSDRAAEPTTGSQIGRENGQAGRGRVGTPCGADPGMARKQVLVPFPVSNPFPRKSTIRLLGCPVAGPSFPVSEGVGALFLSAGGMPEVSVGMPICRLAGRRTGDRASGRVMVAGSGR